MKTKFLSYKDKLGEDYSTDRTCLKEIAFQLSRIAEALEKSSKPLKNLKHKNKAKK